ncbi:MAG: DoxX family membrane protein [Bacteroidales bacterium]|nr:DoxX family membrane protein [Bacteroidales bacterium]
MEQQYSKPQLWMLVILRVAIGWHLLYEGVIKLMNPNWSSVGYLLDSKGWFAGVFHSIAANPDVLQVADFLNIWGLILVGLGLILGLFTKLSSYGGIALLALYYLSHPPLLNEIYAIPSEGNYLFINKNLIELITLTVLVLFPTGKNIGLDRFIFRNTAAK